MKNNILKLKEQYHAARTEKERAEIDIKIKSLVAEAPDAFAAAMVEAARQSADHAEELTLREQLNEVLPAVSLAYISKTYFGRTRQWLYQRINGSVVNGKPARLSDEERIILESAFKDISSKLSSLHVA
jgi:hypothetical protein